jgi:DNA recombination protein RmuC
MEVSQLLIAFLLFALLVMVTILLFKTSKSKTNNGLFEQDNSAIQQENGNLKGKLNAIENELAESKKQVQNLQNKKEELIAEMNVAITENENLQEKLDNQKTEISELKTQFQKEFELLANKILKQNAEEFSKTNSEKISNLLNPLKEKLDGFEKQIQTKYDAQLKDTESLKTQIESLVNLNTKLSLEAENLTKALKGDSKKQGNWGEFILERILEMSGLRKGEEYFTQYSDENNEGKRIQPDVVIQLPEEKHIIIDSKVSLTDYERYISSTTDEDQTLFLKAHLNSVRNHIKGLSEKNYQTSKNLTAPDFVLLFIPIESSFSLAISNDAELFNFAWDKKIVLVSPATLLATLRTIANIWKQERQNKNALVIADQAGKLYDKFVGFVEDLTKIEKGLNSANKAYDEAINKLQTGRGNLINRVENLRTLGAKANKQLPEEFSDFES